MPHDLDMPRQPLPHRPFGRVLVAATLMLPSVLLFAGPAARAASPRQKPGPTVSGSIVGDIRRGGFVTIRISATHPLGWRRIDLMQVTMLQGGEPLGQVNLVPAFGTVTLLGGNLVQVGADNSLTGTYFRFTGLDVTEVTGGLRVVFSISAHVIQAIPRTATFQLSATDQSGTTATVSTTAVSATASGGFSWGTLATAVVAALFIGSLVGGLFASRRRPAAPRISVYSAVQRRIEQDRTHS